MNKIFSILGFLFSQQIFAHQTLGEHYHLDSTLATEVIAHASPSLANSTQVPFSEYLLFSVLLIAFTTLSLIIVKKISAKF